MIPQVAFWGICLIILGWIAATILFEIHLGWPVNGVQWAKRLVGWGIECWLIRAFIRGAGRHYPVSLRPVK